MSIRIVLALFAAFTALALQWAPQSQHNPNGDRAKISAWLTEHPDIQVRATKREKEFQKSENILNMTTLIVTVLILFSTIHTAVTIYKSR